MKILFVALPGSVHTVRWINQISSQNWDIHFFPSNDMFFHDDFPTNLTAHLIIQQKRSNARQTGLWYPLKQGDRLRILVTKFHNYFLKRSQRLANLIKKLKPDIVHSLEMQSAGYLTMQAKRILDSESIAFPKWIYSCWGNDIYLFGKKPEHISSIREVLTNCNFLITDCERDIKLARDFGFLGECIGVFPTGGGFEVGRFQGMLQKPASSRRIIALKGINGRGHGQKGLVALEALEKCCDSLKDYEIVIYLASPEVAEKAERMKGDLQMNIKLLPQGSHDRMMTLMGESRVAIGLSLSDGTPNTMLEAMAMGAFPIQSDTGSTAEWITNGQNGLLVPPEDSDVVAEAIKKAINDDEMVTNAAKYNIQYIKTKLDRDKVQSEVVNMYKRVFAQ